MKYIDSKCNHCKYKHNMICDKYNALLSLTLSPIERGLIIKICDECFYNDGFEDIKLTLDK